MRIHNDAHFISSNDMLMHEYFFINNTNAVSVKDFGAIENDSIDDSEKIQNAINYINSIGGGVVEFPVGNFLLGNTIFMENNVDLIGAGINKTRLS